MGTWGRIIIGFIVAVPVVMGQDPGTLQERLDAIKFPAIARQARQRGDVRVSAESGNVHAVSGPALLRESAIEGAKLLAPNLSIGRSSEPLEFIFHYGFADELPVKKVRLKGDAFDRVFLRLLHLPTSRTVMEVDCHAHLLPGRIDSTRSAVEVWVSFTSSCVMY